jgi:hypothetical protein
MVRFPTKAAPASPFTRTDRSRCFDAVLFRKILRRSLSTSLLLRVFIGFCEADNSGVTAEITASYQQDNSGKLQISAPKSQFPFYVRD